MPKGKVALGSVAFSAEGAVTQTFGILAKRGAGKSNAAAVIVEDLHAAHQQVVVVDPVGAWWGLRSAADGKGEGLPVPILGGARGDVPLEPTAGKLIADLVVSERLSCVLDTSAFEEEAPKRRFLADFAERLYVAKGKPGNDDPMMLVLEEADDYAPQRASGEIARTLGAFERIVKRGRARGIGATMISQRSAAVNKDLLTQVETLIVLRTASPNDRKAVAGWVEYHEADRSILETLSRLKPGEAWVWSPGWLELVERVQLRRRWTFDSGATPSARTRGRAPATLADVDLGALQERMAATIERQRQEDPAELRRELAQLRKEHAGELETMRREVERAEAAARVERERVEVPVLSDSDRALIEDALSRLARIGETAQSARDEMLKQLSALGTLAMEVGGVVNVALTRATNEHAAAAIRERARAPRAGTEGEAGGSSVRQSGGGRTSAVRAGSSPAPRQSSPARVVDPPDGEGPNPSQQRILDAIAWLDSVGLRGNRVQVAFLASYRPGGRFNDVVSSCKTAGWIDYPEGGRKVLTLTGAGLALAEPPAGVGSTAELQAKVLAKLNPSQRRVLKPLIGAHPRALPREDVAAASGYSLGGRFNDVVSSLRSLGVIEYPEGGRSVLRAADMLFLERAA